MPYPSSPYLYPSAFGAYPSYTDPVLDPLPPLPPPPPVFAPSAPSNAAYVRPEWSYVIGPATGGLTFELASPDLRTRTASFKLTAPSETSCVLDGRNQVVTRIDEMATDLHLLRAPARGQPKQRLYRGRIGTTTDTIDENKHEVTVPSLDYRAVLKRRALMSGSTQTWTTTDQAVIAFALLTQTQDKPGGDLGITVGEGATTGVTLTRAYNLGDMVGDKIQELSELDGTSFDWDITSTSPTALQLDIWYPNRGFDRGVVVEFGAAIKGLTRTVDPADYANAVRLSGTAPDGGGAEPAVQERTVADITTRPEGRWDAVFGETVTTTAALSDRADWRIANAQVITPAYQLTMQTNWWGGPSHVWLGDPVRMVIYSGRLRVDDTLRVQQIDVTLSDEGDEDVVLTLGASRPDYRKTATDIQKRLRDLERR